MQYIPNVSDVFAPFIIRILLNCCIRLLALRSGSESVYPATSQKMKISFQSTVYIFLNHLLSNFISDPLLRLLFTGPDPHFCRVGTRALTLNFKTQHPYPCLVMAKDVCIGQSYGSLSQTSISLPYTLGARGKHRCCIESEVSCHSLSHYQHTELLLSGSSAGMFGAASSDDQQEVPHHKSEFDVGKENITKKKLRILMNKVKLSIGAKQLTDST